MSCTAEMWSRFTSAVPRAFWSGCTPLGPSLSIYAQTLNHCQVTWLVFMHALSHTLIPRYNFTAVIIFLSKPTLGCTHYFFLCAGVPYLFRASRRHQAASCRGTTASGLGALLQPGTGSSICGGCSSHGHRPQDYIFSVRAGAQSGTRSAHVPISAPGHR